MRLSAFALVMFAWFGLGSALDARESETVTTPTVSARLITALDGVPQGTGTLSAAVVLELEEGWKTYWRSPGEVGLPPRFDWSGSKNLRDATHLWPAPNRFTAFGIENFGYETAVTFPVNVTLVDPGAPVDLKLTLDLLVCADVCVPEQLDLSLAIGTGAGRDSTAQADIAQAIATVPEDGRPSSLDSATYFIDAAQSALFVAASSSQRFEDPDLFPEMGEDTIFGKPDIRASTDGRAIWAQFPILSLSASPRPLSLTLTDPVHPAFTMQPDPAAAAPKAPFDVAAPAVSVRDLALIVLTAMVGGLLLNVMPCVLPVLGIKVASLVSSAGQERKDIRMGLMATTFGILLFMWVLAALLITLKLAGASVGWGIQFQNPVFVGVLIVVMTVFAGNLFGLFEIALPQALQSRVASGGRTAFARDASTGFFAALLATPCSAPFLGTAVAFALGGRPLDIFVIFTSLGVGLSLPYILLALRPALAERLPKPGPWMIIVRWGLGMLLMATTVWLTWVSVGVGGVWVAAASVGAGVAAVLVLSRRFVPAATFATLVAGTAFAAVSISARTGVSAAESQTDKAAGTAWVAFDRSAIPRHISQGHVVFVDVTADWCITCKANKTLVLDRVQVAATLQAEGVIAMRADWTQPDDAIAAFLEANNRFGIPFNAVFGPAAPDGIILPEVLRPGLVIDALQAARQAGL